MALPIDSQPTPTVPTVVSKLSAPASNNIAIAPIIPTDPLFPPHLRPQRPYHLGEDIMEVSPIILPLLPLFQLTHYSLHIYDPKDHITWGKTSWKSGGEHFIRVEDKDDNYYWITC